jgi:CRP-like cAMP-binding protein
MELAHALARPLPAIASAISVRRAEPKPPEALPRLFRAKEMVFLEGEPAKFVYRVVDGAVRLLRTTPDGRRQVIGFACPGDWLALGTGSTYAHTAEALVDCRLKPMSRSDVDRRMREDRGFVQEMMDVSAETLRQAEELLILLGQRSALEKVASFILSFGRRMSEDLAEIRLPMDRTDIADYLGLTIETVSRKFTQLKTIGVIALPSPSCVHVRNEDILEAIAAGEESIH